MSNPSSDQTGVFDDLRGDKSRDPDVQADIAAAQAVDTTAHEPTPEGEKAAEGSSGGEHQRQLHGRIKQLEQQLSTLDGYAQFGLAVTQTDEGKAVVERWQKGEKLFQEAAAVVTGKAQAAQPGITSEGLTAELDRRDAAKRQMDELNSLAEEKLPQFAKIRKSKKFTGFLDAALAATWNGTIELDPQEEGAWGDQVAAKNWASIKQAYHWHVSDNPKVLEAAKAAGKKEAEERAEAALAGELSSPSKRTSSDETAPKSDADEMIERMMRSGGVGKSFSTVGRSG